MLIPAPFDELSVKIVRLLLERGSLPAREIDRQTALSSPTPFSSATLYRHLKALVEAQVMVHHRGRYDLSPLWKESMCRLSRLCSEASSRRRPLMGLPLKDGERRKFFASSLLQLDPIWNTLLIEISSLPTERRCVGCNSHWWHAIGLTDTERALFEILNQKVDLRFVVGSPTPLDEHAVETLSLDGLNVTLNSRSAIRREGYAVWASDSYVLEIGFPASIVKAFNAFYRSNRSDGAPPDIEEFRNIFRSRDRFVLSVTKNGKRAREVREMLG